MKAKARRRAVRREPQQQRARQTVEAVLDAVSRIAKREGASAVTTNRIAEVAGVSIGSVYQYFPDKGSIFAALHRRHVDEIDRLMQNTLIENVARPLDLLVRALIEAMVDAHSADPQLHEMLFSEVPHRSGGSQAFAVRSHGAFRMAFAAREHELKVHRDLDLVVFTVAQMVEALSHGAALQRPKGVSIAAAKQEAIRAVLAYLHSTAAA